MRFVQDEKQRQYNNLRELLTEIAEPFDWLAEAWRKRCPGLPEFRSLFGQGKLHLLLDGLNEMPHRDKVDYRERIDAEN